MAFNNVPVNGWPQIKGIEEIKKIPGMTSDINTLNTKLTNAIAYNNAETIIGTWGNDTLYRRVYNIGAVTANTETTVDASLGSNIDIKACYGYAATGSSRRSIPNYYPASTPAVISCYYDATNDKISVLSSFSVGRCEVVLEYIKTQPTTRDDTEPAKDPDVKLVEETETTKRSTKKTNGGK